MLIIKIDPVGERIEKARENKRELDEYKKKKQRGQKDKNKLTSGADDGIFLSYSFLPVSLLLIRYKEDEGNDEPENEDNEEIQLKGAKALVINAAKMKL